MATNGRARGSPQELPLLRGHCACTPLTATLGGSGTSPPVPVIRIITAANVRGFLCYCVLLLCLTWLKHRPPGSVAELVRVTDPQRRCARGSLSGFPGNDRRLASTCRSRPPRPTCRADSAAPFGLGSVRNVRDAGFQNHSVGELGLLRLMSADATTTVSS